VPMYRRMGINGIVVLFTDKSSERASCCVQFPTVLLVSASKKIVLIAYQDSVLWPVC
jgi:hypothetical protein